MDIDVEPAKDEKWVMHTVKSLPYGRDPYAVLRKPLSAGRRGYQYTYDFRDRADIDMTLLWTKGDTLDSALVRLLALQPDPLAGRAPRDSMLPESRASRTGFPARTGPHYALPLPTGRSASSASVYPTAWWKAPRLTSTSDCAGN